MTDPLDACLRYLDVEKNASPHTLRSYRTDLNQFCDHLGAVTPASDRQSAARRAPNERAAMDLDTVDERQIRAWLAHLHRRGLDAASISRKLAAVRSWMKFLARRGRLERNPAVAVRGPRLARKLVSVPPVS